MRLAETIGWTRPLFCAERAMSVYERLVGEKSRHLSATTFKYANHCSILKKRPRGSHTGVRHP